MILYKRDRDDGNDAGAGGTAILIRRTLKHNQIHRNIGMSRNRNTNQKTRDNKNILLISSSEQNTRNTRSGENTHKWTPKNPS